MVIIGLFKAIDLPVKRVDEFEDAGAGKELYISLLKVHLAMKVVRQGHTCWLAFENQFPLVSM